MTSPHSTPRAAPSHTPGPLYVHEYPRKGTGVFVVSPERDGWTPNGHLIVAKFYGPSAESNARLIASAPSLLAQRDALLAFVERVAALTERDQTPTTVWEVRHAATALLATPRAWKDGGA